MAAGGFFPAWTDAEKDRARRLVAAGAPMKAIAEELGRSVEATRMGLRRAGIPRPKGLLRVWSERDDRILRALWKLNVPPADIRGELSEPRTERAIKCRAWDLGLRRLKKAEKVRPERSVDVPADEPEKPAPKAPRPVRVFSEIETRRIRRFRARGDGEADIARQMRCKPEDVRRALA